MPDEQLLTDAELEAMEARDTAATPGPWIAYMETRFGTGGESMIQIQRDDDIEDEIYLNHLVGNVRITSPNAQLDNDIDFIAAARQDMPRLIAEVRRLRKALRQVQTDPSK